MNDFQYLHTFLLLSVCLITSSVFAQTEWSFDKQDVMQSNNKTALLKYHSIRQKPELTKGIKGKAIRTDGYSTWLSTDLEKQPAGISAWYALESFPNDTAAFFALSDYTSKQSVALCVDRFGSVLIGCENAGSFTYHATSKKVKRFEWIHVALSLEGNMLTAFINGEKVWEHSSVFLLNATSLHIAKDVREKKQGIFDLTLINGLIDEVCVWQQPLMPGELKKQVLKYKNEKPILAIPSTRFANDFSRPKYHLLPAANWTNETHGLIFYKNRYHIFNQKNASNLLLRQINWGHFSSTDLINWKEHIPALTPSMTYDQNGIWSGHVVLNDAGIPEIIYTTGGENLGIGIAFPKDDALITWEKFSGNPVITSQPSGYSRTDLRDPYVWKENNSWYMIVGFGVKDSIERGAVLLYKSTDLKQWRFLHTLYEGNPDKDDTGIFWEMPVFKKFNDKYVLLVNKIPYKGVPARAMYWVGNFVNEKFVPDHLIPQNLEIINRLLSPSVAVDKDGRTIAIAIIPDEIGAEAAYENGWTHVYSIPRVWQLRNGKIYQTPHPVLQQLREKSILNKDRAIIENQPVLVSKGQQQLEIDAAFTVKNAQKFGFILYANEDGSEYTKVYYDAVTREMVVDQSHSTLKEHIPLNIRKEKYELDISKEVRFHIYIDGSVAEFFINNEAAFTTRVFPLKENSDQVKIFTENGSASVSIRSWALKTANMETDF